MVKDRLAELQQARVDDSEPETGDVVISVEYRDSDVVGDDFFTAVADIQEEICKLRTDIDKVKKKHSAILSAPFPEERTREELDQLMTSIKKDANRVRGKLKGLDNKITEAEQENGNSTGVLIQKTQHETLMRTLVQVMTEYSIVQANYRDACKNRIRRQLEITGRETTDEEIEEMLEQGNVAIFTQGIIMETQQARQTLADIEARHADIIQLEKSIRELHDMFMEMAMLVENQGEKIDSIEFNVERAGNCVNEGKKELVQAADYQSKARRKKIFIIICVAVLLIIILAILLGVFV